MTNKEKLVRDLQLIAENHGMHAGIQDFLDDIDNPCIYGGCNVPTLSDVQQLCKSVGLPQSSVICSNEGIDIYITDEWYHDIMHREWQPTYETWLRYSQTTIED